MKRKPYTLKKIASSKVKRCWTLIPLNTAKIRRQFLNRYRYAQKSLEKLEQELLQHTEQDEAEYQTFLAREFGAAQTQKRELEEKIHLLRERLHWIHLLAHYNHLSEEKYCISVQQKVTEKKGFWDIVQDDLNEFQEWERKKQAEHLEQMRKLEEEWNQKHPETSKEDSEDDEEVFEDPFDEDEELKKLFEHIFGFPLNEDEDSEDPSPNAPNAEQVSQEIKRIYRDLCQRYHPDKIGTHTDKMQRLWNRIQQAYQEKDLESLRALQANADLENGNKNLSCAEIQSMTSMLKADAHNKRYELRSYKSRPYWGFTSWSSSKMNRVRSQIQSEFDEILYDLSNNVSYLQNQIDYFLRCKPRPQKTKEKKSPPPQATDLFDFFKL